MTEQSMDMLSAYLDGECSPEERATVEARCATDPVWQAELDAVRSARSAVRGLPPLAMPAGLTDAVAQAIATEAASSAAAGGATVVPIKRRTSRWVYSAVGGAVASAAALLLVVVALPTPSNARPVRPAVAVLADAHNARTPSEAPMMRVASASISNPPATRGTR